MQILINEGQKVDVNGNVLEYADEKDYGVKGSYYPIPTNLLLEILDDIYFPLGWLNIPLFVFPYRLMLRDKNGWTGSEYNGRAYPTHIIYGARNEVPTKESIGALIIHEIGHALMYISMNTTYSKHIKNEKFKTYMKLRNIPDSFTENSIWEKRPGEVFAEDFRYLFGTHYMTQEKFLHYNYVDPPGEKIRKFMIDLIGGEDMISKVITLKIDSKEYDVDGQKKGMDTAPFIKDDRTFVPIRFVAEELGYKVEWINSTREVIIRK